MKVFLLVTLTSCLHTLTLADYPRFQRRGYPPQRMSLPGLPPQYMKMLPHLPMPPQYLPRPHPIRKRVIPLQMPGSHKMSHHHGPKGPMGGHGGMHAPVRPANNKPARGAWKNGPTNNYKKPVDVKQMIKKPEKPFVSSPPYGGGGQEHDYHIHTNSIPLSSVPMNSIPISGIPMSSNTIKQVGEKGPIHTIPAPNLSLADKPIVVEEIQKQPHQHQHQHQHQNHNHNQNQNQNSYNLQQSQLIHQSHQIHHQYQVTETTEPTKASSPYDFDHFDQQNQNHYTPESQMSSIINAQSHPNKNPAAEIQDQSNQPSIYYNAQDMTALPQDLFQVVNNYQIQQSHQNQQAQSFDSQRIQAQQDQIQDQFLQDAISQGLLEQAQQNAENSYMQQLQKAMNRQVKDNENYHQFYVEESPENGERGQQVASEKVGLPELFSFNYEEPTRPPNHRHYYNDEDGAKNGQSSRSSSYDEVAQSQYVQNYFDTRMDGAPGNNIEPDAKPSRVAEKQAIQASTKPGEITSAYFSTLPSKQAADALASLQAAGKINSNLMQITEKKKLPVTIYVPDDVKDSEVTLDKSTSFDDRNDDAEYEDYEEYSDESGSYAKSLEDFGEKIKPKKGE